VPSTQYFWTGTLVTQNAWYISNRGILHWTSIC
jgi:hypothetical protein